MGAHPCRLEGNDRTFFAVWAPNASEVSVIGDFNGWDPAASPLTVRQDSSGIFEGFVPGATQGTLYKYSVQPRSGSPRLEKGDPYAFFWELPPRTASVVWDLAYPWKDQSWMTHRHEMNALDAPISVYEVHAGSWRRVPGEGDRPLSYRELASTLPGYVADMGFTHVEFLPLMEHPFYGSWGYQTEGYFAPTSRYGTPQDCMYLIDALHREEVGVILDWVPSHFPTDAYGLGFFDGTHLYEHATWHRGIHPEWQSYLFNYGRHEVSSFLLSSALFWLDHYHADAIRVDAVASMLYLDYARREGDWSPNAFGGRENLDAIHFIRLLNEAVYREHPDVQVIAEESTAWPMVTAPTYAGGLGFGLKWNMGWMHDTLAYFSRDPVHRKYHQDQLTFSIWYAFSENYLLPLSHDETVHGKGSLLSKMPGDDWQKAANLRLLIGLQYTHPGKKLLFMGSEFGQWREWNHDTSLDWHLLSFPFHSGIHSFVRDANRLYRAEKSLHRRDCRPDGFEWIDFRDADAGVISFLRMGEAEDQPALIVCNMTPVPRYSYRIGVPLAGRWREVLNSDAREYGGSGLGNYGSADAPAIGWHGRPASLSLTLPPLSCLVFVYAGSR